MKNVILTESQFNTLQNLIVEEFISESCLHIEDVYNSEEFKRMCEKFPITDKNKLLMATQTSEFLNWFGDSVTNGSFMPKIFYHQTNSTPFKDFMEDKIGSYAGTALGKGYYFSNVRYDGSGYGKNELRTFLKIENPYYCNMTCEHLLARINKVMGMDCGKDPYIIGKLSEPKGLVDICGYYKRNIIRELGYDAVVWNEEYMVFSPQQIMMIDWRERDNLQ